MGIKDLLRFVKPYIEPIHIKKYAGKRVGIDAYSWLHKGAYSCSMELCLNSNEAKKLLYIEYFMHRINLLRHYKITPVVVFDGGNIPCKAATEGERKRKRRANHELAMEKLKEGNVSAAIELFQRAVSVTPHMAHKLIQVLRSEKIEFVVAPYEADAQLAYVSNLDAEKGGIEAVITEDSDLLAYGCPAVVFKMDRFGNGERIELDKVFNAETCNPSFRSFNMELFTGMCVLAGCDFLPSVPGIGIVRAHNLVSKYRNLDRILSVLKIEKSYQVPEDYSKSFKEAVAVFQHARIYDTNAKELKHMKPLPQELLQSLDGKLDFLGPKIPKDIVTAIAEGNLNPSTKESFDRLESSVLTLHTTVLGSTDQLQNQKDEVPATFSQESCFTVFSSHSIREDSKVARQNRALDKENCPDEALGLHKLIMPLETSAAAKETPVVSDEAPLKVPDNNPFKIRKPEEISLLDTQKYDERVHRVSSEECLEILSPDSFQEYKKNLSRKRKFDNTHLDQLDSAEDQISGVTEVESADILCRTLGSQESVNSKTSRTISDLRGTSEKEKKFKRSKYNKTASKNGSILNFFSRV